MNRAVEKKALLGLLTVLMLIKFALIEYYFLVAELTDRYTALSYFKQQFPIFTLYKLALFLIVVSWIYLMPLKRGAMYLLAVNALNSTLVGALSFYVRSFNQLPSLNSLKSLPQLLNARGSVYFLFEWRYLLLFVDLIFFYWALKQLSEKPHDMPHVMSYNNPHDKAYRKPHLGMGSFIFFAYLTISMAIVVLVPHRLVSVARAFGDPAVHFYHDDALMAITNHTHVVYALRELYSGISRDYLIELNDDQKKEIDAWIENRNSTLDGLKLNGLKLNGLNLEDQKVDRSREFKRKNIILLQVESLETQLIGKEVNGRLIMPFLTKLVSQSVYYPNIYEQVGEGNSSDAEFMVNTGLYPSEKGVTFYQFSEREFSDALPNILKEYGYYSMATHGDRKTFWNRDKVYPGFGYDEFLGIDDYEKDDLLETSGVIGMGLSDWTFLKQSVSKIEQLEEPYLANLITLTTHSPFKLSKAELKDEFPEIEDPAIRAFAEAFSYLDKAIENFYVQLNKKHLLDDTILVIFGDHQGINKYYTPPETWRNDYRLPLIVWGLDETAVFPAKGGQIDIMPTVLEYLGIEWRDRWIVGKSLVGLQKGYVMANRTMIDDTLDRELMAIEARGPMLSDIISKSRPIYRNSDE